MIFTHFKSNFHSVRVVFTLFTLTISLFYIELHRVGSLKGPYVPLKLFVYHMPVKSEQIRVIQTTRNFELFD